MRYLTRVPVHSSFSLIARLAALATIAGCAGNESKAESPAQAAAYDYPASESDAGMEPASRALAPGENGSRAPAAQASEPAPERSEAPAEPLDDAQIAAITDAANAGEVEQAQLALTKAKNARVRKFAQMMVKDHGQAKKDGAKLATQLKITPIENSTSGKLREQSTTLISSLKEENNFDQAYIGAQVDGHRKVLELFDTRLIPNAKEPKLLSMLQNMRPKIEAHLNQALEIQQALSGGQNRAGAPQPSGAGSGQGTTHDHDQPRSPDQAGGATP